MADPTKPTTPKKSPTLVIMPIAVMAFAIVALLFFMDLVMGIFSNGTVISNDASATVTIASAKASVGLVFPAFQAFESSTGFAGHSVVARHVGTKTYLAYEVLGSGVPIAQATCFSVDAGHRVTQIGVYPNGESIASSVDDLDPRTCRAVTKTDNANIL
jgi:hypothetical protein